MGDGKSIGLRLVLLAIAVAAVASQDDASAPKLKIVSATRSARRILKGDQILEYQEIDIQFESPVYVKSCSTVEAVHVAEAGRCASCPAGCVLSAMFSRSPYVPDLLPKLQAEPECICGISYEEMQLRTQGWPGDQGFDVLTDRVPAYILGVPTELKAYGTAIWQFDALLAEFDCPNFDGVVPALARIRRFGYNAPPLAEGLWWLRRFETAFGVEEVDRLLANTSRQYNVRQAKFILPVRRTLNGRTRQIGLTEEELGQCSMSFPLLVGPNGEPAEVIAKISDLEEHKLTCKNEGIQIVQTQIKAVLGKVLTSSIQPGMCTSDWRTSFPPRGPGGPGGTSGREYSFSSDVGYTPSSRYTEDLVARRVAKVGILALRRDFQPPVPNTNSTVPCSVLRWQLRLRAHNSRERAVSYTAMDAVNGCWDLMERSVQFATKQVTVESQNCQWEPDQLEFNFDPCCNLKMLRWQCCRRRPTIFEKQVAVGVNEALLTKTCRVDSTGAGTFAKTAVQASLAWHRRLTEASGLQRSWQNLASQEQAHAAMWRTVEGCHAAVMGMFDRRLGMYVGSPCLVDDDCFTDCRRPALPTLHIKVSIKAGSKHKPLVLGRCTVPGGQRHVYIMRCVARRAGKEVIERMAEQLGLSPRESNEAKIVARLPLSPDRKTQLCVGPQSAPGTSSTREACLAFQGCNWHHEIRSKTECEEDQFQNNNFCGCKEGVCPQQSIMQGCRVGSIFVDHCRTAREMLQPVELACAAIATTSEALARCKAFSDTHSLMMRNCLRGGCYPRVLYIYVDQQCNDNIRREFAGCYDRCVMPSGPNPNKDKKVCYYELWENETAQDCYMKPGDTSVHWAPPAGGLQVDWNWNNALKLDQPEDRKSRYCSIRVWQELQQTYRPRSLDAEEAYLQGRVIEEAQAGAVAERMSEGKRRREDEYLAANPPAFSGCDLGDLPMTAEAELQCYAKVGVTCCFSPVSLTLGACKYCTDANSTVCRIGDRLNAVWAPNMERYPASLAENLGQQLTRVDWQDGEIYYREVPWSWLWNLKGTGCHAERQGCATHDQCPTGEYCFGCGACFDTHGGNPPPGLCGPCPTHRGGACGKVSSCTTLQDGIDGACPAMAQTYCPCKKEWQVRYQYPGAPTEESIRGCYFDVTRAYSWCEVDQSYYGSACPINRETGKDRFIFWKKCEPESCEACSCNCTKKCTAYDVIPLEGRSPPGVIIGTLDAPLDGFLSWNGGIAPNCSKGSANRIRRLCTFCVSCCADYCSAKAQLTESFDCTATKVSGCSDRLHGWVDSGGRSCPDYALTELCTEGGLYGPNWLYNPPRTFADFAASLLSAAQTCCACGGGVDCSDHPYTWQDPTNFTCMQYETKQWCNRTGYGPKWSAEWGPFPIGTEGVDAKTACCFCGGGQQLEVPMVKNSLVVDLATCKNVWPARSIFGPAPWIRESIHLCQHTSNVCMRKLQATAYDAGYGGNVPEDSRIYGLCMQRAYSTGMLSFLEDFEMTLAPGTRRLSELDHNLEMKPTNISKLLFPGGAYIDTFWTGARAKGMCIYRLPDPLQLFGGPSRVTMPPPLLPKRAKKADLFETPSLQALGWPSEFAGAMFEDGDAQAAQLLSLNNGANKVSSVLRGLLANNGVEIVLGSDFRARLAAWQEQLEAVQCQNPKGKEDDLTKYKQNLQWKPGFLTSDRECIIDRCDVDPMIQDEQACRDAEGCSTSCVHCASRALATQDQGICCSEVPDDVKNCPILGGILVEGMMFDEASGVRRYRKACALPQRPLLYCQGAGNFIKRCAYFDEDHCEGDPIGDLLGCALKVRPCQTRDECLLSGSCSDIDLGLSHAVTGTCVITPLDDDLLQRGCDGDGLCVFKIDPPFGMEVRMKHGMLDLSDENLDFNISGSPLEDASSYAKSLQEASLASQTTDGEEIAARLRGTGRLNRTECDNLNSELVAPFKAAFIESAKTPQDCARWRSCCLLRRGDRCELFSGQVVDTIRHPELTKQRIDECSQCGGTWEPVFLWQQGEWKRGKLVSPGRDWYARKWGPINQWVETVSMDVIRQLFENALESRIGSQRLNAAAGMVEPLLSALQVVASSCGSEAEAVDNAVARQKAEGKPELPPTSQFPPMLIKLGNISATSGLISEGALGSVTVSWHEFSTERYGASDVEPVVYEVSVEPLEFLLGSAAPQIALPGRPGLVRQLLEDEFTTREETTTTLSPKSMETLPASGLSNGGYPEWIVMEMMSMGLDPTIAQDAAEAMLEAASRAQQERLAAQLVIAKKADASVELPEASAKVLLDLSLNRTFVNGTQAGLPPLEDMASFSCRNVLANNVGEVIGQLIGDCVMLKSSKELFNSVEMCMPVSFGYAEDILRFNATPQAQRHGFVVDFSRKSVVPDTYDVEMPPPLFDGNKVPGKFGSVMWTWEDNARYGRLPSGFNQFEPLALPAELRNGTDGPVVCSKVFSSDWTYCPILRLDVSWYKQVWAKPKAVNVSGPPKIIGLDSDCTQLDSFLARIQAGHRSAAEAKAASKAVSTMSEDEIAIMQALKAETGATGGVVAKGGTSQKLPKQYVPLDMQVSDIEGLNLRARDGIQQDVTPTSKLPVCLPGSCLARSGRGFQVVAADREDCLVAC